MESTADHPLTAHLEEPTRERFVQVIEAYSGLLRRIAYLCSNSPFVV